jgi:hypothetical protein
LLSALFLVIHVYKRMDEAGVEKAALMGMVVDPFPEPGLRRRLCENFAALAGIG